MAAPTAPTAKSWTLAELITASGGSLACRASLETWFFVYEERDKEEGKGGRTVKYVVPTREEAVTLSKGLGVYGADGEVKAVQFLRLQADTRTYPAPSVLVSLESPINEKVVEKARLRASAMSKLSRPELDALLDD